MASSVIALGFFDGVHLGHGQLLRRCREEADRLGVLATAVTFDRHPSELITGHSVPLLSTPRERMRLMQRLYGMDQVLTLPFDEETLHQPWQDFLQQIIDQYHPVGLVCGYDFRFGYRGEGTALKLLEEGARRGIPAAIIPAYELGGITVSSTYIRSLVEAGDMEQAARYLGHPYSLTGTVVSGKGLGRTLEVPTANLDIAAGRLLPPWGVYACRAKTAGGTYLAVANLGIRPTVDDGDRPTVEPWLLDFSEDLYGQEVELELHKFLRGERKFPHLQELKAEIRRNAQQARDYFENAKEARS